MGVKKERENQGNSLPIASHDNDFNVNSVSYNVKDGIFALNSPCQITKHG